MNKRIVMKNTEETKQVYKTPIIEHIILDNQISLAMESTPPEGPDEVYNKPTYMNSDPFKTLV